MLTLVGPKRPSLLQHEMRADARYGSFATFARFGHVRSYSNSDRIADILESTLSAISDIGTAANSALFNHLVGALLDVGRHVESERRSGFQIDQKLEPRRLLDREVGRLGAFENLVHVDGGTAIEVRPMRTVSQRKNPGRPKAWDRGSLRHAGRGSATNLGQFGCETLIVPVHEFVRTSLRRS